jgi:hypothetical protein
MMMTVLRDTGLLLNIWLIQSIAEIWLSPENSQNKSRVREKSQVMEQLTFQGLSSAFPIRPIIQCIFDTAV